VCIVLDGVHGNASGMRARAQLHLDASLRVILRGASCGAMMAFDLRGRESAANCQSRVLRARRGARAQPGGVHTFGSRWR
jgi:hypothetical protein